MYKYSPRLFVLPSAGETKFQTHVKHHNFKHLNYVVTSLPELRNQFSKSSTTKKSTDSKGVVQI
jgi:hypothetical protein